MSEYRINDIGIYKPNRKTTGSVAQFKLSGDRSCMFLELAKQVRPMDDPKPYDWSEVIRVKLGQADLSKMLAYFHPQIMYYRSPPEPLKLFHKNKRGSKSIELKWQEREYQGKKTHSYYLTVSSKEGDDLKKVSVPIGLDEVELLKIGFTRGLEIILGW